MRKLSLLLVVVAVFALSASAFAAPLNGDSIWHTRRLHHDINVNGTVGPYAAFFPIDNEVELDWIGHEYEVEYGSARFAIKSNTPIKLVAEFAPLTNGEYQILTELDVERYDGQLWIFPTYTPVMFGIATNGTRTLNSFGVVQTVDHKEYRVGVGGMLGDIHHQAAGEYNTTIHFTIEAAN